MSPRIAVAAVLTVLTLAVPATGRAHCDTLGGPVVASGRTALETGDPAHALVWVKPQDEREIHAAFRKALGARDAGPEARAAAERRFVETLVRVHRRGEGAPYTGLKPAGEGVGEAVRAADEALRTGSASAVEERLAAVIRAGVEHRFAPVSRPMPVDDVAAGRAWVAAYVRYVHYVEALEELAGRGGAAGGAGDHHGGGQAASGPAPAHAH